MLGPTAEVIDCYRSRAAAAPWARISCLKPGARLHPRSTPGGASCRTRRGRDRGRATAAGTRETRGTAPPWIGREAGSGRTSAGGGAMCRSRGATRWLANLDEVDPGSRPCVGLSGSLITRWPAARCRQTRFSKDGYGSLWRLIRPRAARGARAALAVHAVRDVEEVVRCFDRDRGSAPGAASSVRRTERAGRPAAAAPGRRRRPPPAAAATARPGHDASAVARSAGRTRRAGRSCRDRSPRDRPAGGRGPDGRASPARGSGSVRNPTSRRRPGRRSRRRDDLGPEHDDDVRGEASSASRIDRRVGAGAEVDELRFDLRALVAERARLEVGRLPDQGEAQRLDRAAADVR